MAAAASATASVTAGAHLSFNKRYARRTNHRTLGVHLARIVPVPRTPDLCCAFQTQKETRVRGEAKYRLLPEIDLAGRPELLRHWPLRAADPLMRLGIPLTKGPHRAVRRAAATVALVLSVTATGATAASAAVIGPDVSSHNHANRATVNWVTMNQVGRAAFVFIKATEGGGYRNPTFSSDFAAASSIGLIRGAYHFARPSGVTPAQIASRGAAEANSFGHVAGTRAGPGDLPPVLDLEDAGSLNPAQLSLWTHAWLDPGSAADGAQPDRVHQCVLLEAEQGELCRVRHVPTAVGQLRRQPAGHGRWVEELRVLAVHRNGTDGRHKSHGGLERIQRVTGSAQSDDGHSSGCCGGFGGFGCGGFGGRAFGNAQIHHAGRQEVCGHDTD